MHNKTTKKNYDSLISINYVLHNHIKFHGNKNHRIKDGGYIVKEGVVSTFFFIGTMQRVSTVL